MNSNRSEAPGVGLTAPQMDLPLQFQVTEDREEYLKDIAAEELRERERQPIPFQVNHQPKNYFTSLGGSAVAAVVVASCDGFSRLAASTALS
ncbi:MAG: hypothetical protein WB869_03965, partial [Candidatus Acidiferrales bacterium]